MRMHLANFRMTKSLFKQVRISSEDEGKRLQNFLRELFPQFSGKQWNHLLDEGVCSVNGQKERFGSYRLQKDDRLVIRYQEKEFAKPRILREFSEYFAMEKPSGFISSSKMLKELFPNRECFLVHRLDKDTSGVLLVAKSLKAKAAFERLFRRRKVNKVYYALVKGIFPKKPIIIKNLLVKAKKIEGQTLYRSGKGGKEAETHFSLVKKGKGVSLVSCIPITGRTHQIRVHLAELGYPILGDALYEKKGAQGKERLMLHALSVEFPDSFTNQRVMVKSSPSNSFFAI